jgi:hypothetical protein
MRLEKVTFNRSTDAFATDGYVWIVAPRLQSRVAHDRDGNAVSNPMLVFSSHETLGRGQYLLYKSRYYVVFDFTDSGYYFNYECKEVPNKV